MRAKHSKAETIHKCVSDVVVHSFNDSGRSYIDIRFEDGTTHTIICEKQSKSRY